MSDNGTPESFDAQPVADPIPDAEWAAFNSGQSRRKFLRNALIGSAAAAAVVGTATTLIVTGAGSTPSAVRPKIVQHLNPLLSRLSPLDPSSLCLEDTTLPGSSATCFGNGTNTSGNFWLFFTIRSVPVGNYTAEVTQSTNGGVTQTDFTTSSAPFKLDNSQAVHVNVGGTLANCPTAIAPNGTQSANDPVAVNVTGSTQDVQIALHFKWNSTGSKTVTFNATLKTSPGGVLVAAPASVAVVTPCP